MFHFSASICNDALQSKDPKREHVVMKLTACSVNCSPAQLFCLWIETGLPMVPHRDNWGRGWCLGSDMELRRWAEDDVMILDNHSEENFDGSFFFKLIAVEILEVMWNSSQLKSARITITIIVINVGYNNSYKCPMHLCHWNYSEEVLIRCWYLVGTVKLRNCEFA